MIFFNADEKKLCLTRSQRKEKLQELENNAPIKRASLLVMKGLVSEFLSYDVNERFCYDSFFTKKKMITHGSRRKFYNGILEENKIKIKRKLFLLNQPCLLMESLQKQKHARYVYPSQ